MHLKKINFSTSQKAIKLSYRKFGEKGINFVLLHGMFGSGKNWNTFASYFKENFRIWALDARNHGDSPHSGYMDYYEMSEDVINFLNKNGIKKIILLGHSMGGKTAMHLALNYQERVLALIVVDIAPLKYTHYREQHEIINSMQEIVFKPEMSRAEIEKKLRQKIHDKRIISFLIQGEGVYPELWEVFGARFG